MAFDGTDIWVSNSLENTLSRIDPTTNTVTATIEVYPTPGAVRVDGSNLWVTTGSTTPCKDRPNHEHRHGTVTVGAGPYRSVGAANVWVANVYDNTVSKIDPATNGVTATIDVPGGPRGLAFDGNMWVTSQALNKVSEINTSSNAVTCVVSVPGPAWAIAFDGTYVWATFNNSLAKIDLACTVAATVPVGTSALAVAADGTNLWVANYGADNVSKVDPVSNTVTQTIAVGHFPIAVAFDGDNVWVTNQSTGTVSKILTVTTPRSAKRVNRRARTADMHWLACA